MVKMLGGGENREQVAGDREQEPGIKNPEAGFGRALYPSGCTSLPQAMELLEESVTPAELQELDRRIQGMIQRQFTALVHVCMTSANVIRGLLAALLQETEAFLGSRLEDANVVEMFLAQHRRPGDSEGDEPAAAVDLAAAYEEAAPELFVARTEQAREMCILTAPPGPGEESFRQLAQQALPETALIAAPSADEILFYREETRLPLSELKHLGPLGREAYRQMTAVENFTPHSRVDVAEWRELAR